MTSSHHHEYIITITWQSLLEVDEAALESCLCRSVTRTSTERIESHNTMKKCEGNGTYCCTCVCV